jgi:hypothetical protein
MRVLLCATVLAVAIATATAAASNQYLCITESVGGLHYDAGTRSWKPQGFKAGAKYILRRITADDVKKWDSLLKKFEIRNGHAEEVQIYSVGDWAFVSFGEPRLLALCLEATQDRGLQLPFVCQPAPFVPVWDFGTDTHRFEMVNRGAFIEQGLQEAIHRDPDRLKREPPGRVSDPSRPDDLAIEIGECSPF